MGVEVKEFENMVLEKEGPQLTDKLEEIKQQHKINLDQVTSLRKTLGKRKIDLTKDQKEKFFVRFTRKSKRIGQRLWGWCCNQVKMWLGTTPWERQVHRLQSGLIKAGFDLTNITAEELRKRYPSIYINEIYEEVIHLKGNRET